MSAYVKNAARKTIPTIQINEKHLEVLESERNEMLPIEAASRQEAEAAIAELQRQKRGSEKGKRLGLQILSTEIFGWKKSGLPAFAPFSIEGDGKCKITEHQRSSVVPACCWQFYSQTCRGLTSRLGYRCLIGLIAYLAIMITATSIVGSITAREGVMLPLVLVTALGGFGLLVLTIFAFDSTHELHTALSGVIPHNTRKKIADLKSEFQEIFILAEANWKTIIRPGDPLVVGYDSDYFWLIDVFDTAPLEALVADEYCQKPGE